MSPPLLDRVLAVMPLGKPLLTTEITRLVFPNVRDFEYPNCRSAIYGALVTAEKWGVVERISLERTRGQFWRRIR